MRSTHEAATDRDHPNTAQSSYERDLKCTRAHVAISLTTFSPFRNSESHPPTMSTPSQRTHARRPSPRQPPEILATSATISYTYSILQNKTRQTQFIQSSYYTRVFRPASCVHTLGVEVKTETSISYGFSYTILRIVSMTSLRILLGLDSYMSTRWNSNTSPLA
ncbi:hypothetical protein NX059_010236 [Plenodomus lindquistii]|nr:hypothetical protein NX059_010236 [Plenodomus lindquistii]